MQTHYDRLLDAALSLVVNFKLRSVITSRVKITKSAFESFKKMRVIKDFYDLIQCNSFLQIVSDYNQFWTDYHKRSQRDSSRSEYNMVN